MNPKTGRPFNVQRNGVGYRFRISVNGIRYSTITYPDPFTPASVAHTSDQYLMHEREYGMSPF